VVGGTSGDVLVRVLGQDFIDQRLIADLASARLFSNSVEYVDINANCNELTGAGAERRPSNASH